MGSGKAGFLSAATGEFTPHGDFRHADGHMAGTSVILDKSHALLRWAADDRERKPADDEWTLLDADTFSEHPAPLKSSEDVATILLDGRVLLVDSSGPDRLVAWGWRTGARAPFACADPAFMARVRGVEWSSWLPSGRFLVHLDPRKGWWLPYEPGAWAVVDPLAMTVTPLTPWGVSSVEAVAVLGDGSLLAIEDFTRVVRFGPTFGAKAVLYPKETPR